jgi:hypothetical protein
VWKRRNKVAGPKIIIKGPSTNPLLIAKLALRHAFYFKLILTKLSGFVGDSFASLIQYEKPPNFSDKKCSCSSGM